MAVLACAGCQNPNWFVPDSYHQAQLQALHQQQLAQLQQAQQVQQRASGLDSNNQELQQMLAESRQQVQLLQSHLNAVRGRLKEANDQLAQVQDDKRSVEQRVQVLEASSQRRGGVAIQANSNLKERMPQIDTPGVDIRLDGDVVRCSIPADVLFVSNSSHWTQGGDSTIEKIGTALARAYPDQMIGIEGHTDSQPISGGTAHHLTAAQALAVSDLLTRKSIFANDQIFTAGHGANQPKYSNATGGGQQRNRRIEIVVYPEVRAGAR